MFKPTDTRTFSMARPMALGLLAVCALFQPVKTQAYAPQNGTTYVQPAAASLPALDNRHLFALGMIETGNNDRVIGSAGEVSRYQLSPSVWKSYSRSANYQNPDISLQVARLHWNYLAAYFKEKTGRTPGDYDMYVLWNTRYGYYEHNGFSPRHISHVVQDRARRFVNLVNRQN